MKNIFKNLVIIPTIGFQMVTPALPSFDVPSKIDTPVKELTSYELRIKLDTNAPIPITSEVSKPVITPGKSLAQEREEELARLAAVAKKRDVAPRDIVRTSDPGLEVKRALVKKIAAERGIDWKILEAVWQVETGKRWDSNVRSYAGATGPMQFMPGTFRKYRPNAAASIYSAEDSLKAASNLLYAAGLDRGDTYSALFAYNHADWYVKKVQKVATSIVE